MADEINHRRGPAEELAALMDAALAGSLRPDALPDAKRDRMRGRIRRGARERSIPGTRTLRSDEDNWNPTFPGVRTKMLREDKATNSQTFLVRIDPGAVVPGHFHPVREETLVLRGDLQIDELELNAGDAHFAEKGSTHPPLSTRTGAVLLVRMGDSEA